MAEAELRVRDLVKRFGRRVAADRITLDVERGELVAVLGPSGSGKSTLLRMVGGQLLPDSGAILLAGDSIVGLPPNRIDTATVFQDYALFPHYTVVENIEFGLRMRKWSKEERRARAMEMLELLGMEDFADRSVGRLSGGERQRVATARALAVRPRLLLMDEPLGALDRLIKIRVQRELSELLHDLGVSTLYVTHDQREALTMADRIALLRDGRLEQIGTPTELIRRPASRFVAEFLGGGNYLEGHVVGVSGSDGLVDVVTRLGVLSVRPVEEGAPHNADVTVHIRPEDFVVHPGPDGNATVKRVAYTGEVAELELLVGASTALMAKELGISELRPGDTVTLGVKAGLAIILRGMEE